jgi:hypothetical protein
VWDKETLAFMERIFQRSGLDKDGTYLPHAIHPKFVLKEDRVPDTGLDAAAVEARTVGRCPCPAAAGQEMRRCAGLSDASDAATTVTGD